MKNKISTYLVNISYQRLWYESYSFIVPDIFQIADESLFFSRKDLQGWREIARLNSIFILHPYNETDSKAELHILYFILTTRQIPRLNSIFILHPSNRQIARLNFIFILRPYNQTDPKAELHIHTSSLQPDRFQGWTPYFILHPFNQTDRKA